MPIKPLTVLPQLRPVTYRDPGQQGNQSLRILEEMIQQENTNERSRRSGVLMAQKELGDFFDVNNQQMSEAPFQEGIFGAVNKEKSDVVGRLKDIQDPIEQMNLINQAKTSLYQRPDYAAALREQASFKQFNEIAKSNAKDIDPDFYSSVVGKYYDPNRKTPMRADEFNPGRLLMTPEKFGKNFVADIATPDEKLKWDDENNKVYVNSGTAIPSESDFKSRLRERMQGSVVFSGMTEKEQGDFVNRTWKDAETKYSGKKIEQMQNYETDTDKAVEAARKAKEADKNPLRDALEPGGDTYKFPDGSGYIERGKDGIIRVYDKDLDIKAEGKNPEDVWNKLPQYIQNQIKELGHTPDFDYPDLGMNKKDIQRDGESVNANSLAEKDRPLAKESVTAFTEDSITTNDPEVLERLGYSVTYDKKKKKYTIAKKSEDGSLGAPVEEGSGGFTTSGGSSTGSTKMFTIKTSGKRKEDEPIKDTRVGATIEEGRVGDNVPKMRIDSLKEYRKQASDRYAKGEANVVTKMAENMSGDSSITDIEGSKGRYQFRDVHRTAFLKGLGHKTWKEAQTALGEKEFAKKEDEYFDSKIRKPAFEYFSKEMGWDEKNRKEVMAIVDDGKYDEYADVFYDYIGSIANQSSEAGWKEILTNAANAVFKGSDYKDAYEGMSDIAKKLYEARVEYIMGLPEDVKKESEYYKKGKWEEAAINRPYRDYIVTIDLLKKMRDTQGEASPKEETKPLEEKPTEKKPEVKQEKKDSTSPFKANKLKID